MKLYVGNLDWGIDDEKLAQVFASYGDVQEAIVIKDRMTNRSKGFGFVTFTDEEAGKAALADMDGKEVEGRPLRVSEARPMEKRD